jgi:RNA polymerase sigma-B factor
MSTQLATHERLGMRSSGEEMIARYRRTGDRRLRERAIEFHMPLARRLAMRYQRRPEAQDDLIQVAYLGLVKAVDRFDPERGTRFSSFAIPTITGELRRHFRATAWNLHVPRAVQEDVLVMRRASQQLGQRVGRAPTVPELAEYTGRDVEAVAEALDANSMQSTVSLDQPRAQEDSDTTLAELIGAEDDRLDLVEHEATVAPLIRALPERERQILFLRFAHDMTQSEIAERIGCSQMQISRLLRRALARLSQVSDEPQTAPEIEREVAAETS